MNRKKRKKKRLQTNITNLFPYRVAKAMRDGTFNLEVNILEPVITITRGTPIKED